MKYVSRPKSTAVKDIDIGIADMLGHKHRYRIDIGKGDLDPPLAQNLAPPTAQMNINHQ